MNNKRLLHALVLHIGIPNLQQIPRLTTTPNTLKPTAIALTLRNHSSLVKFTLQNLNSHTYMWMYIRYNMWRVNDEGGSKKFKCYRCCRCWCCNTWDSNITWACLFNRLTENFSLPNNFMNPYKRNNETLLLQVYFPYLLPKKHLRTTWVYFRINKIINEHLE